MVCETLRVGVNLVSLMDNRNTHVPLDSMVPTWSSSPKTIVSCHEGRSAHVVTCADKLAGAHICVKNNREYGTVVSRRALTNGCRWTKMEIS